MVPTWTNGRAGSGYIAKRLDRFIINAGLIEQWGMPIACTGFDCTSDHRPIFLEWRDGERRMGYSFKFNRTYLEDESFHALITKKWGELKRAERSTFSTFRDKIQLLRVAAKDWLIKKRKSDKKALDDIKNELRSLTDSVPFDSLSFDQKIHFRSLEKMKQVLLLKEESTWRLKSRAVWLKEGDRNTRFFHNFANGRRIRNSIWRIKDENGSFVHSKQEIEMEATKFFQKQYKRRPNEIGDVFWMIEEVPVMFNEADNTAFLKEISEEELCETIKKFHKDKSPGPDGWPIEFFSHFFDLFKTDLLSMADASRMSGNINSALSATFITLIPKKEQNDSFADFRPIALCNILFKIISKIIAERMKPFLNSFISKEQHAFLKHRNILDVVASTQECLFSVLSKNTDAAILKIDLEKAYDCVD